MIEIFSDRMEITNPGIPLVDTERFLDSPPKSRNEEVASFMRRIGVCEERGSGFDKVVNQTEIYQLPAPQIIVYNEHTKVILYTHKPLSSMEKDEKTRACYLHACLKHVNGEYMNNSSLRERFGIEENSSYISSRIIRETLDAELIKPFNSETAPRYMKYLPYWA
jgi:predicted HTH transcriptional regulator